jgi:hypothetical protein
MIIGDDDLPTQGIRVEAELEQEEQAGPQAPLDLALKEGQTIKVCSNTSQLSIES